MRLYVQDGSSSLNIPQHTWSNQPTYQCQCGHPSSKNPSRKHTPRYPPNQETTLTNVQFGLEVGEAKGDAFGLELGEKLGKIEWTVQMWAVVNSNTDNSDQYYYNYPLTTDVLKKQVREWPKI